MASLAGIVFDLEGPRALSDFREERLLRALRAVEPSVEAVSSRFIHFVHASDELTDTESSRLASLLDYGPGPDKAIAASLEALVVPRLGTISPWASKATDIARNCGIEKVLRVERGTIFTIALNEGAELSEEKRGALLALLHDRMTESVVPVDYPRENLFTDLAGKPMETVPLMAEGKKALEDANLSMGLALSEDEVE